MQKPPYLSDNELNQIFIQAGEDQQQGLFDSAEAGYLRLLHYFPDAPILHSCLGSLYYASGNFTASRDCYIKAASLSPEDLDILFNLALAFKKSGDLAEAIVVYKKVAEAQPESVDVWYNLAGCYKDDHQYEKATETYLQVLKRKPEHPAANNNLAYVYHLTGASDMAVFYYQKVLHYKPDHQAAQHMLAALKGAEATASPDSYVREVFDNYSLQYEQALVEHLNYRVPAIIRQLLDESPGVKKRYAQGLDLGCGTGLSGQAFGDIIDALDGIDLSPKMLELAAAKNIYRRLYADNINSFLQSSEASYNFYLAADVFGYVGDLAETFSLLRGHAREETLFCFSTEAWEGTGYRLQPTGRFAHAPAYIHGLAGQTGWSVARSLRTSLRKEKDNWVQGDIWLLLRQEGFLNS